MQVAKNYFNSNDARSLINVYGFAIFPIHGIHEDQCTCGNKDCTNKGKHPATNDGFKSASNDIEIVKQLWAGRQHLNVGIATGKKSGIFVIDIDSEQGEKDLKAMGELPPTLTVSTGKGKHLYFKYPNEPVITKTKIVGDYVDVRGDGGYVAGAGSNHASGTTYEFINELEDIAEAPKWLLDLVIKSRITPKTNVTQLIAPQQRTTLIQTGWTQSDVQDMLDKLNPDMPYDEWVQVGMAIQSEGFPFSLWDDWSRQGTKYNQQEMTKKWNSFKGQGISFGTLVNMAKAAGWSKRYERSHVTPTCVTEKQEVVNPETGEIEVKEPTLNLQDWVASKKFTGEAPKIEWLIDGTLQKGIPALLAAMGGLGKSFTILDLCIEIASGTGITNKRMLGGDVMDHGKCVFITAEDSLASVHRRIEKICTPEKLEATKENLIVVPMPELGGPKLLVREGRDGIEVTDFYYEIRDQLEAMDDLKLIVFDPLQAFVAADITSKPESAQFMWTAFAHIASATNASMMCTHHMRKDGLKNIQSLADAREAVRGTTGLIDGARLVYAMWQAEEKTGRLLANHYDVEYKPNDFVLGGVVKSNDDEKKQITSFIRQENGVLVDKGGVSNNFLAGSGVDSKPMSNIQKFVYEAIVDAIITDGKYVPIFKGQSAVKCITYEELRQKLEERGYKEMMEDQKKTTSQQIKSATQSARIALQKKGKINFNGSNIWLVEDTEKNEGM